MNFKYDKAFLTLNLNTCRIRVANVTDTSEKRKHNSYTFGDSFERGLGFRVVVRTLISISAFVRSFTSTSVYALDMFDSQHDLTPHIHSIFTLCIVHRFPHGKKFIKFLWDKPKLETTHSLCWCVLWVLSFTSNGSTRQCQDFLPIRPSS